MALIQRLYRPKVGLVCIGDRFTMGPETAAIACNELDMVSGRPEDFKGRVTLGRVHVAAAGEAFPI